MLFTVILSVCTFCGWENYCVVFILYNNLVLFYNANIFAVKTIRASFEKRGLPENLFNYFGRNSLEYLCVGYSNPIKSPLHRRYIGSLLLNQSISIQYAPDHQN